MCQALAKYRKVLAEADWRALSAWASTFYPFQLDWLLDPSDLAIANKSRQIGISHTTAAVGVLWGAFHGELTTIISIGQQESDEVLDKCRRHATLLGKLGSRMAKVIKSKANEIAFVGGGRVLALPSSGGRSFTGNVFLDEFAYQQDAKAVWDAASPVTMTGYRMRVSSTPNGVGNEFHSLWKFARRDASGWAPYEIPISLAAKQGYPVNLTKCWSLAKGDPRLFAQMFECSFLDNALQYVPTEYVDAATVEDVYCPEGETFAGLDVGRTANLTALVIIRRDPVNVCWVLKVETRKRTDYDELERLVALAVKTYRVRRLCIDSTGMGAFPAEQLQKKFGRTRIEPVDFTLGTKEELATTLYQRFAGRQVRIARAEADLRQDVCAVQRIITNAGNVRYDAPNTDEGHADRAWALALALYGSAMGSSRKAEIHDHNEARAEWT